MVKALNVCQRFALKPTSIILKLVSQIPSSESGRVPINYLFDVCISETFKLIL